MALHELEKMMFMKFPETAKSSALANKFSFNENESLYRKRTSRMHLDSELDASNIAMQSLPSMRTQQNFKKHL